MHLSEHQPSDILKPLIKCYRLIDFDFKTDQPIPAKAYSPRPEHCLQFFPTPTQIDYLHNKQQIKPKNALIFGQHTVVNYRTVYKKFLSLQIVFQPGAISKLFKFPASLITNQALDAELVLGREVEAINDQLYHAKNHQQMIDIAERYLIAKTRLLQPEFNRVDISARQMLNSNGIYTLDYFISKSCLSQKQFNRYFLHSVGISPKAFLRIVRFDEAYRLKNIHPKLSWFKLAIDCSYYDYQHLVKDCKDFTGYTPQEFFTIGSPERILGTEEVY